ncbi:MAG: addiction module antitoxin [Rhodospirillaceae bacterium]|nr:addiction module antitoxin [Rhodospirillaceae bacterium]
MKAKKLTITVSAEVYRGLKRKVGPGNISRFLDRLARPYVVDNALEASYREMAADGLREAEAVEWAEGLAGETLRDST